MGYRDEMPQATITQSVLDRARELEAKYLKDFGHHALRNLAWVIGPYLENGKNGNDVLGEYIDIPFDQAVQEMALRLAQLESE